MRTYKTLLTAIFIFCVTFSTTAQNAEKTFVKSFNLKGNQTVELDLKGEVNVEEWNNTTMRVQFVVTIPNISESTLKSLVRTGRYNLLSKDTENALMVFAPAMQRDVKIKGQKLDEQLSYTIYVPSNVIVKQVDEASTKLNATTPMDE